MKYHFTKAVCAALLLAVLPICGWAQIKTSVSSNNRWLHDISESGQTYRAKKKQLKDSLKIKRKLDKYYEKKTDSLFAASYLDHRYRVPAYDQDSTLHYESPLQLEYEYYEARYLNKDLQTWKSDTLSFDSLPAPTYTPQSLPNPSGEWLENNDLYSRQLKELETFNAQRDQITSQQDQIDGYQTKMASGQEQMTAYQKDAESALNTSHSMPARNSILKLTKVQTISQNSSLNEVESTIEGYKKKYESLGSIEDIGKIKTRNSMSSLPLKRRLKIGGSLQIRHDQYLNIDFSPSIAYRLTRRWSTGIGFTYRAEFGNGKEWYKAFDSKTYGGRLFMDYGLFKSFYAHTELEAMKSQKNELALEQQDTTWGLMAGIGKTFSLTGNLRGNLLLQYNFTYEEANPIYSSPWVLRFGFEIHNLEKIFPTHKKGSTDE